MFDKAKAPWNSAESVREAARLTLEQVASIEKRVMESVHKAMDSEMKALAGMVRSVEEMQADSLTVHRRLQSLLLRTMVMTEVTRALQARGLAMDMSHVLMQRMVESMDFPDSWWNLQKNLSIGEWIELFRDRFFSEKSLATSLDDAVDSPQPTKSSGDDDE